MQILFDIFRPPDIHVGGLIFYQGFFLLSFFFFFRRLISELAERNSTKIGHVLGSNCDFLFIFSSVFPGFLNLILMLPMLLLVITITITITINYITVHTKTDK